jgi:hypothetical protein
MQGSSAGRIRQNAAGAGSMQDRFITYHKMHENKTFHAGYVAACGFMGAELVLACILYRMISALESAGKAFLSGKRCGLLSLKQLALKALEGASAETVYMFKNGRAI